MPNDTIEVRGNRYAIIVGVSVYEDDQFGSLQFANHDALRLSTILTNNCQFDKQRIYLLCNGNNLKEQSSIPILQPSKPEILQRIQYVINNATEDDLILFFFAGHGAEISKTPYFITCDTRQDVIKETAVNVNDINVMFKSSKAKCIIKIYDACRSPFGDARGPVGRMTEVMKDALLQIGKGWASISSCTSGEVAYESFDFSQGVFSYYLCEGLAGKAINDDGEITFERLVDYIKTSINNWSDEHAQKQTPHVQSDLSGKFVLSKIERITLPLQQQLNNPFSILTNKIEAHLSQVTKDSRQITFTSDQQFEDAFVVLNQSLINLLNTFSHNSYSVSISEPIGINKCGSIVWQTFNNDLNQYRVKDEYTEFTKAIMINFNSTEIILPNMSLAVATIRFKFFYWVWYMSTCNIQPIQNSFKPNPPFRNEFFTLLPKAALDSSKIEKIVNEIYIRSGADILNWANQLSEYVNARLEPLRSMGEIIE